MNWIDVDDKLPTPEQGEEVIGWVAPYGNVKYGWCDLLHFDGEEWYDRDSRTCTVTHWAEIISPNPSEAF